VEYATKSLTGQPEQSAKRKLAVMMQFPLQIPAIGTGELIIFLVLLVIGIIIIMVLATLIHFIIPIIAAVVVWFFTGSLLYAGIAFVIVAIIQLIARR